MVGLQLYRVRSKSLREIILTLHTVTPNVAQQREKIKKIKTSGVPTNLERLTEFGYLFVNNDNDMKNPFIKKKNQ